MPNLNFPLIKVNNSFKSSAQDSNFRAVARSEWGHLVMWWFVTGGVELLKAVLHGYARGLTPPVTNSISMTSINFLDTYILY